jgi:lipopolysaccharide/colanic/teichoic acid biosynthesis glycosyltransferase
VKRVVDVVGALVGLALLWPLMGAVAIVVRRSLGSPVLFRQVRPGLHGRPFVLLKFRTMRDQSGPDGRLLPDSERLTRLGRFLRATSLDELPELWNVLRGEMSLVGPRPERPHFVAQLDSQIPFHADRTRVKPGITGWAQVNYPYGASVEDARQKLAYDLYYVKHRNLLLDLTILMATVRVILFQEGAR